MHLDCLLSTITSPSFDLVIIYNKTDFYPECALPLPGHVGYLGEPERGDQAGCRRCDSNRRSLKVLSEALETNRKTYGLHGVQRVLCAEVDHDDALRYGAQATVEFITTVLQFHVEENERRESGSELPKLSITSMIRDGYDKTVGL